jgi:hypothetical protein
MKRILFAAFALLLPLVLSSCGGGAYELAYTARGDSTNILGLTLTNQFQATDDLNIVVKLKSHDEPVEVAVAFFNPTGAQEGETIKTTVDKEVGSIVLGLDWESRPGGQPWETGSWRAEVRVNGEKTEELIFRVN